MQIRILFQDLRNSTHKKVSPKLNQQMFANGASYLMNIF